MTKLHKTNEKDEYYMKPRLKATELFGINHYAGTVNYAVQNFLNKNKVSCCFAFVFLNIVTWTNCVSIGCGARVVPDTDAAFW